MPYPKPTAQHIEVFRRDGLPGRARRDRSRGPDRLQAICDDLLANKEKVAFDWAWEAGDDRENRKFKIVQTSPSLLEQGRAREGALPHLGDGVRLGAAREGRRVLVRSVPRQAARARARAPRGTRTRRTGAATSTSAASPAGCPSTTSTSRTAACTSSRARTSRASFRTARRRTCRATSWSATSIPRASCRCPIKLGDVTFHHGKMPHMTTPNVVAALAPRALAALPRGRHARARATTTPGRSTSTR